LSLLELLERLEAWRPTASPAFAAPRAGDQLVFVADSTRARAELGWQPSVSIDDGLPGLLAFVDENAEQAAAVLGR
jgi:nucleoside-diphosphate-sugar epimerase